MPDMLRSLPSKLTAKCPDCIEGKVDSQKWLDWWAVHEHDWKESFKKGDIPSEPEKIDCLKCKGKGMLITRFALELIRAVDIAKKLIKDLEV